VLSFASVVGVLSARGEASRLGSVCEAEEHMSIGDFSTGEDGIETGLGLSKEFDNEEAKKK
jgi:hypothetical protein